MFNLSNSKNNDEINIHEVFYMLWACKLFIAISCIIGIFYGVSYISNADKMFTSQAIFKMDDTDNDTQDSLPNISSLMLPSASANKILPIEMVKGRIFIQALDKQMDFKSDPFFNPSLTAVVTPTWKKTIKEFIGFDESEKNPEEEMWQGIVRGYSSNVDVEITEDDTIKIKVSHKYAIRAAKIANAIMNKILADAITKRNNRQDEKLEYLSKKLANALNELEISQSKLNSFVLQNNLTPKTNQNAMKQIDSLNMSMMARLAQISYEIDAQKDRLKQSKLLYNAASELVLLIKNNDLTSDDYFDLRKKFPIVDEVKFRRILGKNENLETWDWPDKNTVTNVIETLSKNIKTIENTINSTQSEGERIQEGNEILTGLARELRISEATYTVLIEQVKAKSMSAGYITDNSEIYSYGVPAITPSSPRRMFILALSAVLGIFIGSAFAILFCIWRGVFYSKITLIKSLNAKLNVNAKTIYYLRKRNFREMEKLLKTKHITTLQNLAIEINKNNSSHVVISSSMSKLKSIDVAQGLATYMQSKIINIAIINFSAKSKNFTFNAENNQNEPFEIVETFNNISVLKPTNELSPLDFLSKPYFAKSLDYLDEKFDIVLYSADRSDSLSLLSSLESLQPYHIMLAKVKKTKSNELSFVNTLIPVQGLIYE